MKTITVQQVFNNAWQAFVVRREGPGYNQERKQCRYRGTNGCKCAIGHSIPDDFYRRNGESSIKSYHCFRPEDVEILKDLQAEHDISAHSSYGLPVEVFLADIRQRLEYFSSVHELEIPTEAV